MLVQGSRGTLHRGLFKSEMYVALALGFGAYGVCRFGLADVFVSIRRKPP
jgi:hypothetical protein